MSWAALEAGAPEIASAGRARLELARVGLLGTIRADGSPRISPVEPYFAGGRLVLGVMSRSAKAADLRRDPRCAFSSAVSSPDAGAPELKLYGRVEALRERPGGWWTGRPEADAEVYELHVQEAVLVEWDLAAGRMRASTWSAARGSSVVERAYP